MLSQHVCYESLGAIAPSIITGLCYRDALVLAQSPNPCNLSLPSPCPAIYSSRHSFASCTLFIMVQVTLVCSLPHMATGEAFEQRRVGGVLCELALKPNVVGRGVLIGSIRNGQSETNGKKDYTRHHNHIIINVSSTHVFYRQRKQKLVYATQNIATAHQRL